MGKIISIFILFSLILVITSGISLAIRIVKKKSKKKSVFILLGSVILFLIGVTLYPKSLKLTVISSEIQTDGSGKAIIEGNTTKNAVLSINGKLIENKQGTFAYTIHLEDEKEQQYTIKAALKNQEKEQKVSVKPSSKFLATIEPNKSDEKLTRRVETALVVAEKKPSQSNYNEAVALVRSLGKNYDEYNQRLTVIQKQLQVAEALDKAEQSLSSTDLELAEKLISATDLNNTELNDRFTSLKIQIKENKQQETLQTQAIKAVEKAEAEPTERNLAAASSAIAKLHPKDKTLTQRIEHVKETIQQEKKQEETKQKSQN